MNRIAALLLGLPAMGVAQDASPLPGLTVEYSTADGRMVRDVIARPAWSLNVQDMPHALLPTGGFRAAVFGWLVVPSAGAWRLRVAGTGTTRVLLRGRPELQAEGDGVGRELQLPKGPVPFELQHERAAGQADRILLFWRGPEVPEEPIPASAFVHERDEQTAEIRADLAVERGRRLFDERRCGACHRPPDSAPPAPGFGTGPDLTLAGARNHPDWMDAWLFSPTGVRISARMPSMFHGGEEDERKAVAAWLASLGRPEPEPAWSPGAREAAVARGRELFVAVGCAACHEPPVLRTVPRPGALLPLSGISRKWNNHGALTAFLQDPARTHPFYRMPSLLLDQAEARALAAFVLYADSAPDANPELPDATLAARGRELVRGKRCAACHTLPDAPAPPVRPLAGIQAAALRRGCLATTPILGAPYFELKPEEKDDLRAYVRAGCPKAASRAPGQEARWLLDRLFCNQCHTLGVQPGQAVERTRAVAATLGLPAGEPIAPPGLDGVGHRVRPEWLARMFTERVRVRPYHALRMPQFDPRLVAELPSAFASWAGEPLDEAAPPPRAEASAQRGRELAGKDGLGCVTCHAVGAVGPAPVTAAARGPDLLLASRRLRHSWFLRWLMDPARIEPATAMPAFFSEAAAAAQGEDLWAYFALADAAPLPAVPALGELPGTAPRILHTAIAGLPRAIVVGFRGGWSCAYDADSGLLARVWHGGFLRPAHDAASAPSPDGVLVWERRTGAIEQLTSSAAALPARPRLLGYRLDAQGVPNLRVLLDEQGTVLEHSAAPLVGAPPGAFVRKLLVRSQGASLLLWTGAGEVVESGPGFRALRSGDRWWLVGAAPGQPEFRSQDGAGAELRLLLQPGSAQTLRVVPSDGSAASLATARRWISSDR